LGELTVDAFGAKHSAHASHAHEFKRFEGSEALAGRSGADLGPVHNTAQKCFRTEVGFEQRGQLIPGVGREPFLIEEALALGGS